MDRRVTLTTHTHTHTHRKFIKRSEMQYRYAPPHGNEYGLQITVFELYYKAYYTCSKRQFVVLSHTYIYIHVYTCMCKAAFGTVTYNYVLVLM